MWKITAFVLYFYLVAHFLFLEKLLMELMCCYPCRISYIVMIGQVLRLLGYTRNNMLLMGWEMVVLYLPFIILSLEHITLARQWHIVTKLQLWVPIFSFSFSFVILYNSLIYRVPDSLIQTISAIPSRFLTHIRRKWLDMELLLLITSNSTEFEMELILIFGIHILMSLFRYAYHHGVHSYVYILLICIYSFATFLDL